MKLHPNTDFSPQERAVALVEELEREALDENMVHSALGAAIEVMRSRQQVSEKLLQEAHEARVHDNRRELLAAKVKGVRPQPRGGGLIQPANVIPSRH